MNAVPPIAELTPHKLTVDELLVLDKAGAFSRLPRMELLDGTLYEMSPQSSVHVRAKNRITFRIQSHIQARDLPWEALCEPTVSLGKNSAPEPDVIICDQPAADGYYPAASVLLAVEVAATTLKTDLDFKKALYASAAIPEYWVLDVEGRAIHQFWSPQDGDYAQSKKVALGEPLTSATIPDLKIETSALI